MHPDIGKAKKQIMGTHPIKRKKWDVLSDMQDYPSVNIGDIPVTCKELCIRTLFVGSHAIRSYIQMDQYAVKQNSDYTTPQPKMPTTINSTQTEHKKPTWPKKPKTESPFNNIYEKSLRSNQQTIQMPKATHLYYPNLKNNQQSPPSPLHPHTHNNTAMDLSDEEFIAQFAALSSNPTERPHVQLPASTSSHANLQHAILARVITHRPVIADQFASIVKKAWAVQEHATFSLLENNTFLIQFDLEPDLLRVLHKGVWNYRGEVVAVQRIRDQAELLNLKVSYIDFWTQLHRVPHHIINNEGVQIIVQSVAPPLCQVSETFANGNKHYKVKLHL